MSEPEVPAAAPWAHVVKTEAELRALYKRPSKAAVKKDIGHIDQYVKRFIELSPFACLATTGANGSVDVTPRGGSPGFAHVLDRQRLAIPDRPGNNRLDTLSNLVQRPGIGLVFFVPGFEDALRVNGRAQIVVDEQLMSRFVVDDKRPLTVIVIEVDEAYFHCGKAVRRAGLWSAAAQVDRAGFPSPGQIYRDQLSLDVEAAAIDDALDKSARETLY